MGPLITFVSILFEILNIAILARVLLSWINLPRHHPIVEFLYSVTEPILAPIRRVIPAVGMLDLSPIVAIVLLELLRNLVVTLLAGLAR